MAVTATQIKQLRDATGAGMMDCKKALDASNGDMEEATKWLRENGIMKAQKKAGRVASEGATAVAVKGNRAVVYEVNCETDFAADTQNFKNLVSKVGEYLADMDATTVEEALASKTPDGTLKDTITNAVAVISENLTFRRMIVLNKTDAQSFSTYIHMGGKIATAIIAEGGTEEELHNLALHTTVSAPLYLDANSVDQEYLAKEREILRQETLNEGKPEKIVDRIVDGKIGKELKEICLMDQPYFINPEITVEQFCKQQGIKLVAFAKLVRGEGVEKKEENFAEEVAKAVEASKK